MPRQQEVREVLIAGNNNNMKHISINDYVNIIWLVKNKTKQHNTTTKM